MLRVLAFVCVIFAVTTGAPSDYLCGVCLDATQDIRTAVRDQQVHARILGQLEGVCAKAGPGKEECNDVITGLTQEVLQYLLADMKPVDLCRAMTVCSAQPVERPQVVRKQVANPMENLTCELCEVIVEEIDRLVTNSSTPAEANRTVYTVCEALPEPLRDTCVTFAPLLLDMLLDGVSPIGACTNLGVCLLEQEPEPKEQKQEPKPVARKPVQATPLCELCEVIVEAVDQYVKENKTEAAINATVYKLCNELPASLKDTCISFAPEVVAALAKGLDPKQACTEAKLCQSGERKTPSHELQVEQGPACELCELIVQTVDQYLKDNKSIAAINGTVYKLCNDLPGSIKDTCMAFAPQLVAELAKGLDPKQACTAIKLCTNDTTAVEPVATRTLPELEVEQGPACELCELIVQTVDQYLKDNKSIAAINGTVYKLCNDLPGTIKDTCLTFAPQLVAELAKGLDPKQACTAIKLCTNDTTGDERISARTLELPQLEVEQGPACELCELIVQTVDQYLKDNKSIAAINGTVYKLCNDLPGTIKDTCLAFAPQLVAELAKGLDPKQACTAIKLCTNDTTDSGRISVRTPEVKIEVEQGPACELCELIVQTVDQYLKDNKSIAAINGTVYKLCNDLPGTIKDTCLAFAPQLVAELAKGLDPKQACTAIKLCTNDTTNSERLSVRTPEVMETKVEQGPACELCELIVQTVDQYLKDNKSIAAINGTVYKLCNDLPGTIKDTCLAFAPQLVTELAKGLDPKQACTTIKLCTNDTTDSERISVRTPEVKTEVEQGPACELCELIVQTVDQYLKDNKSIAAINGTVYKLCNDLPGTIKDTCLAFAPQLVAELANGLDPKQACTAIKLCTNDTKVASAPGPLSAALLSPRTVPQVGDIKCNVCKNSFQILDQDLYREEGTLQTFLDNVCHRLPPPTDQACLNAADNKFPEIWEKVLTGALKPDNVCKLLELCS